VAFEKVKQGDILLCYMVKLSRWCGSLEVLSDAFEDSTPIFAEENDPFPIRFRVRSQVMLDFEHAPSFPFLREARWLNVAHSFPITMLRNCSANPTWPTSGETVLEDFEEYFDAA
jgi:hypothetical protein